METSFRHSADMGEISGFGGVYEDACQRMLEAGVRWLNEHPQNRDLQAKTLSNVYGIFDPTSDDAKALEEAVMSVVKGEGATGAMHHAVMSRLFFIAKHGWDKYCEELREREREEGETAQ